VLGQSSLPTEITHEVSGTRVLFNGVAASLLYASATQINVVVPPEVGNEGTAAIEVLVNGKRVTVNAESITSAAPGVFTLDASGVGRAVASHQDGSLNGRSNPASPGAVVRIYATGLGGTTPAQPGLSTALPLTATVGGSPSVVLFAGGIPNAAEGLVAIDLLVPASVPAGDAPVVLRAGTAVSQAGVYLAIR